MWPPLHFPQEHRASFQTDGLPCSLPQEKTEGELSAHTASAAALPRKWETLEFGCRNQDLNWGGGEERDEAATITTDCYHGNFPQISVREEAEDLIIT